MKNILHYIKSYSIAVIVPVLLILALLLVSPETRSWGAVASLLQQSFAPAILGWGVLLSMKVGNWDFSIGARYVLAAILAGNLAMQYSLGLIGFIVLAMVISIVLGLIVGYTYRLLRIPTLIASIGLMLIFESFTRIIYDGAGLHLTAEYLLLGGFPYNLIMFVLCFAFATWLYYKRRLGYNVRAVGSNPTVAQTNGINAEKTKAMALIVSGIFAGLYAILSLSTSGVISAVAGTMGSASTVFDAMMCVLISMAIAGKGSVIFGVYVGAIITQILKMGMMAIGVPTTFNKVIIGVVVVLFMVASSRSDLIGKLKAKLFSKKATA